MFIVCHLWHFMWLCNIYIYFYFHYYILYVFIVFMVLLYTYLCQLWPFDLFMWDMKLFFSCAMCLFSVMLCALFSAGHSLWLCTFCFNEKTQHLWFLSIDALLWGWQLAPVWPLYLCRSSFLPQLNALELPFIRTGWGRGVGGGEVKEFIQRFLNGKELWIWGC